MIPFYAPVPAEGAYVARLEVRTDRDTAYSPPVVLPAPGAFEGPYEERTLASLPAGVEATEALGRVRVSLRRPGVKVRVEGHWDVAEDAEAGSEAIARAAVRALVAAGVDESRLEVWARGDERPRFPTFSKALRKRNRRVELVEVPPPRPRVPQTRLPDPEPRGLDLEVDRRRARIDLSETASICFTMDLDPPAQVQATLHDGSGGSSRMRRSVTSRWVFEAGSKRRAPAVVSARGAWGPGSEAAAQRGPAAVRVVSGAIRLAEAGRVLELELAAPDEVQGWLLLLLHPASGRALEVEQGEGPPPPRLEIALTSTRAWSGAAEVYVVTEGGEAADRRPEIAGPWRVPPMAPEPLSAVALGGDPPEIVFSELLDATAADPEAKLVVQVHGGRRAARDTARRRLVAALSKRGLKEDVLVWSAGRSEGALSLSAHLSAERSLQVD